MKSSSKSELLEKIKRAKKQLTDPTLIQFKEKFLKAITEYERQIEELDKATNPKEIWFASKKDKLKFTTLVYRIKRKIESVVHEELSSRINEGESRIGAVNIFKQNYLGSIVLWDDKSAPKSAKDLAQVIINSDGFVFWKTRLLEKLEDFFPKAKDNLDIILPYEILIKLSEDFFIEGLENKGAEIFGILLHPHKWSDNPKFK